MNRRLPMLGAAAAVAVVGLGIAGANASTAAPRTAAPATALSNTQDDCSATKSLGYSCNTYLYSVNGAGQAVVRPSVCFFQNNSTRRVVVTQISYGAVGHGANKVWVPTSAIAEPGQYWRYSGCVDVFTSWALRSPGAWVNTQVSDGSTVEVFTTYSPA